LEDMLFLLKAEIERVDGNELEIEINPDRQDMLSEEGIARAVKSFLGIAPGLREFPVKRSGKQIIVKPGLSKIRPFIACSIVKNVVSDSELVKRYMHLQEALTATHGRNRRKASIGLYVDDDIDYPIVYGPKQPESIRFVPLGTEIEMNGPSILSKHEKGIEYGPIIAGFKKWPLLEDSTGQILSLPPIINSNDLGRITTETKNIFVEVTGTHLPTVEQALNIMTASLAERGGQIESVSVIYPDGSVRETPDLRPEKMKVTTSECNKLTGLDMKDSEVVLALERMGYGTKIVKSGQVEVGIPRYRVDILHPVDIIEDVAIGYGFDRIKPELPQTMTSGKVRQTTRLKNKVRDIMVGMEYQEVLSYIMTSPETLTIKMLRERPIVVTGNPRSREYSVLRDSLLPILLDFASKNQHEDYPQKVFEVGDIIIPDERMETRVLQIPAVSGLTSNTEVNITDLATEIGNLMRNMGLESRFEFKTREDESFIKGRAADILVDKQPVGVFGEISPQVLANFNIGKPIVAFEVFLPFDGEW
ncbi:MAG: phenylalanine--tRNA ligase subunit beta, partial [Candidatus Thorarchaeota archaeon]|nr:phenylalanine--tRNA ligase subunit beta [Candidatus Thorarchaeota archaeon]